MRVNAHKQNRKIYKMSEFRGVDYSSSPLEVKPYRATDMANLVLKDGTLHKRNGWEQVCKILDGYLGVLSNYTLIGLWPGFEQDVGDEFICQIYGSSEESNGRETRFFSIVISNDSVYRSKLLYKQNVEWATYYHNRKRGGQAFPLGGKIYILSLGYYVYGSLKDNTGEEKLQFKKVANDRYNTFIPTTTINIPHDWTEESYEYVNTSNNHINLLTAWRKNQLYGEMATTKDLEYKLDGRVSFSEPPEVEIMLNDGSTMSYADFQYISGLEDAEPDNGTSYWGRDRWQSIDSGMVFVEDATDLAGNFYFVIPKGFASSKRMIGSTITVTFLAEEDTEEASNDIDRCSVSTIFGVNGANDRIFLAGSHKNPNIVFYSENNEGFQPEPTYFPANHQLVCGGINAPISAFLRVSDGTLAVFKDVANTADIGTYYVGGFYQSLGTGQEGNEYYQAVFNVTAGGIKQKGVSAKTVANLEGDPLFVSKEGVFGIQLSSNVASGERYAKERSRVINTKLMQFDLSTASAIVYKGRYYLSVGGDEDEVYVADSRYKYRLEGDSEDSFNYEWFRWTNIPAMTWFEHNDHLYFISKDGWICRMTDGYADIYLASSKDNQLAVRSKEASAGYYVAFNAGLLPIIQKAAYATDQDGAYWEISNLCDMNEKDHVPYDSFDVPRDITVTEGQDITLRFHLPINAHWKSAIIDLEGSMYRKNLWSLSTTVIPTEGGFVKVGYKTRYNEQMKDRTNKQIEGAYIFSFDDIDFSMFNFDCGGFVNAFRQRVFERGFIYIQLAFASDSVGDCVVTEMALEYSPTIKNMGVG